MVESLLVSILVICILGLLEAAYYSVPYLRARKALSRRRVARRRAHPQL